MNKPCSICGIRGRHSPLSCAAQKLTPPFGFKNCEEYLGHLCWYCEVLEAYGESPEAEEILAESGYKGAP